MAERSDITEEIVRMHSHIGQFEELLLSRGILKVKKSIFFYRNEPRN